MSFTDILDIKMKKDSGLVGMHISSGRDPQDMQENPGFL